MAPIHRHPRRPDSADARRILDAIRHVVRLLRVSARDAERKVGVTGAQLFVLQQLREGPAASVNALAARTHTHQSSVSVVVARLVERGLVLRQASAGDGRCVELRLSPRGRALLRRAPGAAQERLVTAIEALPASARARLSDDLTRLVRTLGVGRRPATMFFEEDGRVGRR